MFVHGIRSTIVALQESGLSQRAIATQLRLAPATVNYHLRRAAAASNAVPTEGDDIPPAPAPSRSQTRAEVARLLALGLSRIQVARRLGVSQATVSYHARRLGQPVDARCARRYDWGAVQRYYDAGHSVRDCIEAFGFSTASWYEAVKRGAIVPRPNMTPLGDLLVADTYRGRYNLKLRLLREGVKDGRCEVCGLSEWRGAPLTLTLHHVNGLRDDNRLENLQLLCPNCHSQTSNFAGRNGRGREIVDSAYTSPRPGAPGREPDGVSTVARASSMAAGAT